MRTKQMKCSWKFPPNYVNVINTVEIVTKILYKLQKHLYSLHIKPKHELIDLSKTAKVNRTRHFLTVYLENHKCLFLKMVCNLFILRSVRYSPFLKLSFQQTDNSLVGYERHENSNTLQTIDDLGGVGEGGELQESVDNL